MMLDATALLWRMRLNGIDAGTQALHAFGHGRFADTEDLLLPVRYGAHVFGGSHAQRDIGTAR